jgi:hypothetical protein
VRKLRRSQQAGCKIGKAISITEGYEAPTLGGMPFLQGATNGTIGPQGATYVNNADQGLALGITIDSEITATFELE